MAFKALPTQERLKELLNYDPDTGIFTWINSIAKLKAGTAAGHLTRHGYIAIRIEGKVYAAHRLAWVYYYGYDPGNVMIDHCNRIKNDNFISNLRLADRVKNAYNSSIASDNTTGYKGVTFNKDMNKFMARISFNKRRIHLGYFNTAEEAAKAYQKKADELHGEFSAY